MYTIFSFEFFFSFWYHWLEKCFPKTLQARLLEQPILGTKFVRKLLIFEYLGGKNSKDRKYVMTTDDLANAMADQGITVKKPPYFI